MSELQFLYHPISLEEAGTFDSLMQENFGICLRCKVINSILYMMGNIKLVVTIFSFLFILHPKLIIPWLVSIIFNDKTESLKLKIFEFKKKMVPKKNHVNFSKSITEATTFQVCMKWKDFLALQMHIHLSHFLNCTDVIIYTHANLTFILLSPFYWH